MDNETLVLMAAYHAILPADPEHAQATAAALDLADALVGAATAMQRGLCTPGEFTARVACLLIENAENA